MDDKISQIIAKIKTEGVVDSTNAEILRNILISSNHHITSDEAQTLFDINYIVKDKKNSKEWEKLFIDGICDFLLNNETSPDTIDHNEFKWLIEHIGADGRINATERKLLYQLKVRAASFPDILSSLI